MARKPDLIAMKRVFQNQRVFLCHFFAHYYFFMEDCFYADKRNCAAL